MAMQLIPVTLVSDAEKAFEGFLFENIFNLRSGLQDLFETKLPRWRRIYEAQPVEKIRTFPFYNASNLVIPLVAIHSDTLLARILASIFKVYPLFPVRILGSFSGTGEPLRNALEQFLGYVGFEPTELDLYRVYRDSLNDGIQYGTVTIKSPWETNFIDEIIAGDVSHDFATKIVYDGPRPEKIAFDDFFISPTERSTESAEFKAHRRRLSKFELESRMFDGMYERAKVKKILSNPDRYTPLSAQAQAENDAGARTLRRPEWDIYECWAIYRIGKRRVRVISSYHYPTRTVLRTIYNTLPDEPFVTGRLFTRANIFHGYGFCELLASFQEEISEIHNGRRDAQTVANAKVWRINPESKLHQGYNIFPSATLPAEKDEIEALSHGEPSPFQIEEERQVLELAERLSGVSPPMQGAGAGNFSKRGVYSSMGTLSMLQEGNTRTDLRIGDMRHMHMKLGRIITRQYAYLGRDAAKITAFGKMAEQIRLALDAIKNGTMTLPIVPATSSNSREVEKQTDIMLTNITSRHYGMITQMLQSALSPQVPPQVQQYIIEAMKSANELMKIVMRHFDYGEPERYIPEVAAQAPATMPMPMPSDTRRWNMNNPTKQFPTAAETEVAKGTM